MIYLDKYYLYYNFFINNFLISKLNLKNNFDVKLKFIELHLNYKLSNKRNWILNLLFLLYLISNHSITYKKQKFFFARKKTKFKYIQLTLKLQKKEMIHCLQNLIFFSFAYSNDFNIFKMKKYIKYKSFNIFDKFLLKNLIAFPFLNSIFKSEREFFYMKHHFKFYLNFVFLNNNNNNNFYNNLNLLKILRFPATRLYT